MKQHINRHLLPEIIETIEHEAKVIGLDNMQPLSKRAFPTVASIIFLGTVLAIIIFG